MKFAVNYSPAAVNLLRQPGIRIDYLKCPAWNDLVREAQNIHPVYVHFPFAVGRGIGEAIDTETGQHPDWAKVETLMQQTNTRFVNLHLDSLRKDFPDILANTTDRAQVELLTERIIRDLSSVATRFGAEHLIAENEYDLGGRMMHPALYPSVIRRIVEETHCGFLLDLSHARLAAQALGMDPCEYISGLPIERIREIHVTGIQQLEGRWLEAVRQCDPDLATRCGGAWIDHMPMTDPDWEFLAWALGQISGGVWARPEIVAFEYGGVGGLFGALMDAETFAIQLPRLQAMIETAVA